MVQIFSKCGKGRKLVEALYDELLSDGDRKHILMGMEKTEFVERHEQLKSICSAASIAKRQIARDLTAQFAAEDEKYRSR